MFCMSGGDAVPGTQTGSASAASFGWSADLSGQWWWCHSVGRSGRRWDCEFHSLSDLISTVTHHAFLYLSLCLSDVYLRLQFDPASFDVSAMMHPSTYLNKVLLGSSQGALQLWNIKTRLACSHWSNAVQDTKQLKCKEKLHSELGWLLVFNIIECCFHPRFFCFFFSVSCCLRSPAGQQESLFCSRSVIIS